MTESVCAVCGRPDGAGHEPHCSDTAGLASVEVGDSSSTAQCPACFKLHQITPLENYLKNHVPYVFCSDKCALQHSHDYMAARIVVLEDENKVLKGKLQRLILVVEAALDNAKM